MASCARMRTRSICAGMRWASRIRAGGEAGSGAGLHRKNLDRLLEAGRRIAPRRGRVFVRDIAREVQIGDGFGHEMVIQLLGLVDLVTPGVAAGVEMPDPL